MNDTELAIAFPSMAPPAAATTPGPTAAPAAAAQEDAALRTAFPSMFKDAPAPAAVAAPAPAPAATGNAPEPAPAPTTPDAPAGEASTVELASGLSITLPAGVAADPVTMAAFDAVATDLGIDGAAAQRLADLHSQAIERIATEETAAWSAVTSTWRDSVQKDPELGGVAFDANVKLARSVLDRFHPALKAELKEMGLGNHPELIRLLVRVGKALPGAAAPESDPFPSMRARK